MTQRIFDIENKKDMQDLWNILPDDIEKIELEEANGYNRFCYKKVGACEHSISSLKLIAINWHDKTEITRPVDYESMIGCVGWFWDNDDEEKSLGVLTEYSPETGFPFVKGNNDNTYSNFCPAKKSELKFWGE